MLVQSVSDKFGVSTNLKSAQKRSRKFRASFLKLPHYRETLLTSHKFRQPVKITALCKPPPRDKSTALLRYPLDSAIDFPNTYPLGTVIYPVDSSTVVSYDVRVFHSIQSPYCLTCICISVCPSIFVSV